MATGVGPEVAPVELALLAPGHGVRLARDAANEPIHEATPRAAVEGADIVPHRTFSQYSRLKRRDQVRHGEGFPLHHNDGASAWACKFKSKVQTCTSGAEADEIECVGT